MRSSTVLIANGEKPKNQKILEILKRASNVICIDNGYELALELDIVPSVLIGDLDSVNFKKVKKETLIVKEDEQNTNDLEKAYNYCVEKNIKNIILIGSTGGRDDQNLANILISFDYIRKLNIEILSDQYSIKFVDGEASFNCDSLCQVSLISLDKNNVITTEGLKYNLTNSKLSSSTHGISNYSINDKFYISSSSPLIVFKKI